MHPGRTIAPTTSATSATAAASTTDRLPMDPPFAPPPSASGQPSRCSEFRSIGHPLDLMDVASGGLLLGRRTYQDVLAYWNTQDSPFRDALNNAPKYFVSNTLTEPVSWSNSTL